MNNTTFYFLQSTSTSTPGILLSVVNHRSNRQESISSDNDLKRLRPCDKLQQGQSLFNITIFSIFGFFSRSQLGNRF